jgi:hypothetical protein
VAHHRRLWLISGIAWSRGAFSISNWLGACTV